MPNLVFDLNTLSFRVPKKWMTFPNLRTLSWNHKSSTCSYKFLKTPEIENLCDIINHLILSGQYQYPLNEASRNPDLVLDHIGSIHRWGPL